MVDILGAKIYLQVYTGRKELAVKFIGKLAKAGDNTERPENAIADIDGVIRRGIHNKIRRDLRTEQMEPEIVETVQKKLLEIEQEHSVRILYAIESGSRAWGFESTDSDYDVRFIYAHPKNWYLNILPKRDVIEYPIVDDFDYSGWDLRKTLFLLNKSNPVLFEWLKSPIVYHKDDLFCFVMGELSKPYFSPISSIYHYSRMASRNYREYLQGDEVKIKKYFYVLRPLMACMWIESNLESPPVEFGTLMTLLDDRALVDRISELLAKKKSGVELGLEPKIQIINDFIEKMLQRFEVAVQSFDPKKKPDPQLMEDGFIRMLEGCGGMGGRKILVKIPV